MGVIKKGASLMAAFTKFGLNEGERLSPFTRSDGPGAESKSIAGLLEDSMLFYIMRHEMSYTMKVTPRQDKWAVGYMIESLILRGLQDDILPHLGTSPLSDEVRKLIELVREDFKDMSINPTAAGLRAQINNTIARIKTFISQQETTATDEQKRLLKGIKRYATGLDGRFRARYDSQQDEIVFTEGEMRYYKESGVNESRYYMDAGDYEWIPNEKIAARERRTDAIAAAAI
jgi:hypothetical protein